MAAAAQAAEKDVAAPEVKLVGIGKRFPGVVANHDVGVTIRPATVHALIGENGAGKSTLMKILYGVQKPDDGEILVGGQARVFKSPSDAIAVGIGMVIWPNGMCALRGLGLEPAGHRIDRLEFYAAGGRRLNAWDVGAIGGRMGAPSLALSRGELHRALAGVYGAQDIAFGADCVAYEDTDDGVTVVFADGRREHGDVLVGADGIVSPIRRRLTGHGPPEFPPYAGYTIWHAIIDHPEPDVPAN